VPIPVSQELLDVVDADDKVVDVMPRGEVHRLGLMHRSVHILVFNSANAFFLQKRSMSKDSNPGLWDSSAAGHVERGEDYLGCAARELGEELGIVTPRSLESLFHLPASPTTGMEHCTVFRCIHDGPLSLQADEIEEGVWIADGEMDRRVAAEDPVLTSILKLIWHTYRRH
jgi:isopentenyldiphosphate isomerase